MRNKEQEMAWRKVIEACMEDVKHHFDDIQQAIEFGCYIQPDNYFVSYIFATDSQLETARQSGLTEQINSYHREQLIKSHYPIEGIKDCTFASQEECDREFGGNLARIGITISNDTMRSEERRVGKECRSRWSPYH